MAQHPNWLPSGLIYDRHLISQIRSEQALHHMQDADVKAVLDASIQDAQQVLEPYLQHRTGCQNYHPALLSGTAIKCLLSAVDIADIWIEKQLEKDYANIDEFARSFCWGPPQNFVHLLEDIASAPLDDSSSRARRVTRRASEILTFRKYTFDRRECHPFVTTVQLKKQVKEYAESHSSYTTSTVVGATQRRRLVADVYNYATEVGLNKAEALASADAAVENLTIAWFLKGGRSSVPPTGSRLSLPSKRKAEDHNASSSMFKQPKLPASKRAKKAQLNEEHRETPRTASEAIITEYSESSSAREAVIHAKEEQKRRKEEKRLRKEAKKLRKEARRKAREEAKLRETEEQNSREEKKRSKEEKKKRRDERERRKQEKFLATTPDIGKARKASETFWNAINQNDLTNISPNATRKDSHQEGSSELDAHKSRSSSPSSDEGLPRVPASRLGSPVDSPSQQLWGESETQVKQAAKARGEESEDDSVLTPTSDPELDKKYLKSFCDPQAETTPRKHTGKISKFFPKLPSSSESAIPVPPLSAKRFGLIQEELADEPFKLLIAVKLLNKTRGHLSDRANPQSAINTFHRIMASYPSPEALAAADPDELTNLIKHLGLQNQRAKILINMARLWVANPPKKGVRYRTAGYPTPGAGRDIKSDSLPICDETKDPRVGAFEIAHIPGVGAYALDSWRIFCRDRLRGLAKGFNGEGHAKKAGLEGRGFEPEWKRVRPMDKELRAFLKWMWLKEGWVWDPSTGKKERASRAMMEKARKGDVYGD